LTYWLVEILTSPFSTITGYIGDKVLSGDLVQIKNGQRYSNLPTSLPFCSTTTQNGKHGEDYSASTYNRQETNHTPQDLFIQFNVVSCVA